MILRMVGSPSNLGHAGLVFIQVTIELSLFRLGGPEKIIGAPDAAAALGCAHDQSSE